MTGPDERRDWRLVVRDLALLERLAPWQPRHFEVERQLLAHLDDDGLRRILAGRAGE